MLLLDSEATITISQGSLITLFIFVVGSFAALVGVLHRDMTKRIEDLVSGTRVIHEDIKPIMTQVTRHDEQLKDVKEDTKDISIRLNGYDRRLHKLETAS